MVPGYDIEHCHCLKLSDSGKAILISNRCCEEFEGKNCWVPISQLTEDSEIKEPGDVGTLTVTEWFAQQKGWLEE